MEHYEQLKLAIENYYKIIKTDEIFEIADEFEKLKNIINNLNCDANLKCIYIAYFDLLQFKNGEKLLDVNFIIESLITFSS